MNITEIDSFHHFIIEDGMSGESGDSMGTGTSSASVGSEADPLSALLSSMARPFPSLAGRCSLFITK